MAKAFGDVCPFPKEDQRCLGGVVGDESSLARIDPVVSIVTLDFDSSAEVHSIDCLHFHVHMYFADKRTSTDAKCI
jgi:hypothetical protein